MQTKKSAYVKKTKEQKNEKETVFPTLTMGEQLDFFAEIIVDIYFELENKIFANEKK